MNYELKPGRIELEPGKEFEGKTLTELLEYFAQSRKNRYLLIQEKRLLLNRTVVTNTEVTLGAKDHISILLPKQDVDFTPSQKECTVVYEDDLIYVVHKEAGVIVHGEDGDTECLAAQAATWQINHGITAPVRYIHRLDKDTTGLVLFVKIPFFQPWFDAMLQERKIHRHYYAITWGNGRPGRRYTFNQKIGRDRHVSGRYRFSSTGQEALTKAECIDKKGNFSLMSCELYTGRTHQIRVHLSGNRHPIVNDPLYGQPSTQFQGMGLWADQITFENPITHEVIVVKDLPNPDFKIFKATR